MTGTHVELPLMMTCDGCGVEVNAFSLGRVWCTRECMAQARERVLARVPQTCATCGASFMPPKRGVKDHCSVRCRRTNENRLSRERREGVGGVDARSCAACGTDFLPNRRGAVQKYCTVDCRSAFLAARERSRRRRPTPEPRDCLVCGKAFVPSCDMFGGVRKVVCSQNCHTRVAVGVKRARKWTAEVEKIYPMVVMERDDWTCGICGMRIDPDAPFPSSRYRSIDHIVPPSQGGTHLYSNVQAAHFGCNVAKGNEVGAEYMTG